MRWASFPTHDYFTVSGWSVCCWPLSSMYTTPLTMTSSIYGRCCHLQADQVWCYHVLLPCPKWQPFTHHSLQPVESPVQYLGLLSQSSRAGVWSQLDRWWNCPIARIVDPLIAFAPHDHWPLCSFSLIPSSFSSLLRPPDIWFSYFSQSFNSTWTSFLALPCECKGVQPMKWELCRTGRRGTGFLGLWGRGEHDRCLHLLK